MKIKLKKTALSRRIPTVGAKTLANDMEKRRQLSDCSTTLSFTSNVNVKRQNDGDDDGNTSSGVR